MSVRKGMLICVFLIGALSVMVAGGKKESPNAAGADHAEKPVVAVSILPQQYFVERIAGDRVSVLVLVGPGQSPHSYEPTPKQMSSLANAGAWILSATDFEIGLEPKIAAQLPNLLIVDGTEGVAFRQMQEWEHDDDGDAADAESENHHHDANIDRHTWLGHEPAKILAGHVRDTLIKTDPEGKSIYEENYKALIQDIDSVYGELATELTPLAGKTVLVYHPAFGYLFDSLGIRQESVETGGKEPTAQALSALIEKAKAEHVPVIFVQAQFPVNAAQNVAEAVGAEVVPLDPLAPDWLENIKRIGDALKKSL